MTSIPVSNKLRQIPDIARYITNHTTYMRLNNTGLTSYPDGLRNRIPALFATGTEPGKRVNGILRIIPFLLSV